MITDLTEIRRLATAHVAEDLEFRRYIKSHHPPENDFHILASRVQAQMDCTACANCCRMTYVEAPPAVIQSLAVELKLSPEDVMRLYTMPDPEDHTRRVLRHTSNGCVFLDGNLCIVYAARPRECRDFPHLLRADRSLGGRMASIFRRASYCPIVYNVLEKYKQLIGFHAHITP